MSRVKKMTMVEAILMRAAEQIGDITPLAMERYYRQHPEAKAAFEKHCFGDQPRLEGQMIENSVHCLMRWSEAPTEIEILLGESVPHHNNTLQVPPDLYQALIEVTADVIATTIPRENTHELAVWNEVRDDLREVFNNCRHQLAGKIKQQ